MLAVGVLSLITLQGSAQNPMQMAHVGYQGMEMKNEAANSYAEAECAQAAMKSFGQDDQCCQWGSYQISCHTDMGCYHVKGEARCSGGSIIGMQQGVCVCKNPGATCRKMNGAKSIFHPTSYVHEVECTDASTAATPPPLVTSAAPTMMPGGPAVAPELAYSWAPNNVASTGPASGAAAPPAAPYGTASATYGTAPTWGAAPPQPAPARLYDLRGAIAVGANAAARASSMTIGGAVLAGVASCALAAVAARRLWASKPRAEAQSLQEELE